MRELFEKFRSYSIVSIIVSALCGLALLIFPAASIRYISLAFGGALLIMGAVGVVQYFRKTAGPVALSAGLVSMVCGVIVCAKALDSAKERLECEHGMVLNNPAYTTYHVEMGEISSYPEGYKENAGIFCHNNPWVIIGETVAGRGNDAWNHYTKILPSYVEEKYQTLHKVEPYVNCQMVAGKDAAKPGEGKNSWLTGTAAWMWYTVSEFILGIKPDYEGLNIDPCLPSTAHEYEVTRKFRGGEYHIVVKNPEGREKGVKQITVDGKAIAGTIVPCLEGKHEVVVEM